MSPQLEEYLDIAATAALDARFNKYLESQHYSMWANWDITREERRERAAQWATFHTLAVLEDMPWNEFMWVMTATRWKRVKRRVKRFFGR